MLVLVGILYLLTLAGSLTLAAMLDNRLLLTLIPLILLPAALLFYALVPARLYRQTLIRSAVSPRWTTIGRITYLSLLFTTLAWLSHYTGEPWGLYYILLWITPLVTSFSFFMILRRSCNTATPVKTALPTRACSMSALCSTLPSSHLAWTTTCRIISFPWCRITIYARCISCF